MTGMEMVGSSPEMLSFTDYRAKVNQTKAEESYYPPCECEATHIDECSCYDDPLGDWPDDECDY